MTLQKNIHRVICLLLALTIAVFCAPAVFAKKAEPTVIRVGYIDSDSLFRIGSDGSFGGYGAELLDEIGKRNNWEYEYVNGTVDDLMEQLDSGEIDLMCHVKKTAERADRYIYCDFAAGIETGVLSCRAEDGRFYYNDFDSFDGMRVGMLKGGFQGKKLSEYAEKFGFDFTPVEYEKNTECYAALDRGEVDAVAMGVLAAEQGYKTISFYSSEPFYFVTGSGNAALMRDVNCVLSEMLNGNPNYLLERFEQYYSDDNPTGEINLTKEENDFLENCGVIKVGQMPTRYPMSSLNGDTGALEGINEDILEEISKISGITFENVPLGEEENAPDAITSERMNFVMGVMDNPEYRSNRTYCMTDSYLETSISLITRKGEEFSFDKPCRIGMKKAFLVLRRYVEENYPDFEITVYDTNEACFTALINSDVDIVMQNVYIANYTMQKPQYTSLQMIPTAFLTEKSVFLADSSADPRLISIMNKAIQALDPERIEEIVLAHTAASPYIMTTADTVYAYRYGIAITALCIVFVSAMLIVIVVIKSRNVKVLTEKNSQLKDAFLHAEEASKAKSSFLSRVSHEIRTPINAISGFTVIARKYENDGEKIDGYLSKIDASAKLLMNIVNDVLDINSLENNRVKIDNAEFDMARLINEIKEMYEPQCRAKGVDFHVSTNITDELLIGDSLRVEQILINLVSNAYKFTESGGHIDFSVSEINRSGSDAYLRFVVADNGCGISHDMMGKLFVPFEQEYDSITGKYGGSGLGLSIVKNLVDMMQGAITAQSEKGKGAVFTVDLPFGLTGKNANSGAALMRAIIVGKIPEAESALSENGISFDSGENIEQAAAMLKKAYNRNLPYSICVIRCGKADEAAAATVAAIRSCARSGIKVILIHSDSGSTVLQHMGADYCIDAAEEKTLLSAAVKEIAGEQAAAAGEKRYDFSGRRVILAEDNEFNAEITKELLSLVNMETDTAKNGIEAVNLFMNNPPDTYCCILMDLRMPEMDGLEAAKKLRSLASERSDAAEIPIYALTANAYAEDITASLSAGMNGHLSKPVDVDILYGMLEKAVGDGRKKRK